MHFFYIISFGFFVLASATSNLRAEFKHGAKVGEQCADAVAAVYLDYPLQNANIDNQRVHRLMLKQLRVFQAFEKTDQKVADKAPFDEKQADNAAFLNDVFAFKFGAPGLKGMAGKELTFDTIYKEYLSCKECSKKVKIKNSHKTKVKAQNGEEEEALAAAYDRIRRVVAGNLKKVLSAEDCGKKILFDCHEAIDEAYPDYVDIRAPTQQERTRSRRFHQRVLTGAPDEGAAKICSVFLGEAYNYFTFIKSGAPVGAPSMDTLKNTYIKSGAPQQTKINIGATPRRKALAAEDDAAFAEPLLVLYTKMKSFLKQQIGDSFWC